MSNEGEKEECKKCGVANHEALLLKIYDSSRRTERWLRVHALISFLKFIIILVPLILAIIYLPPFFEKVTESVRSFVPPGLPGGFPNGYGNDAF